MEQANPEKANQIPETSYLENKLNRKTIHVEDFNEAGELEPTTIVIAPGTITVSADSKRGLYLHLKKTMKASAI